jgi:hypothetical protein
MLDGEHPEEAIARFGENRRAILVSEILSFDKQLQKSSLTAAEAVLAIGHRLIELKDLLGHGAWLPYVHKELPYSEKTAQNYMAIAKSKIKSATLADLGITGALKTIQRYVQMRKRKPQLDALGFPAKKPHQKFDRYYNTRKRIEAELAKEDKANSQKQSELTDPRNHIWKRPQNDGEMLYVEWKTPEGVIRFAYVWLQPDKNFHRNDPDEEEDLPPPPLKYEWIFLRFEKGKYLAWARTNECTTSAEGWTKREWRNVKDLLRSWSDEYGKAYIEEIYDLDPMNLQLLDHLQMLTMAPNADRSSDCSRNGKITTKPDPAQLELFTRRSMLRRDILRCDDDDDEVEPPRSSRRHRSPPPPDDED